MDFTQRFSDKDDVFYRDSFADKINRPYINRGHIEKSNLLDLFEEQNDFEEPDLVQVYLRFKPSETPNRMYDIRSNKCLVTSMDTATVGHGRRTQHNIKKMYTFSHIFGPDSSQKDIFEHVVKHNLQKLPEGHSYTLLTYGASGSGKTYTLMGTTGAPGLVPRSLEYVFRVVDAAQYPVFRPSEGGAEKLGTTEQGHELKWVKKLRQVSAPARDKYRRMSMKLSTDFSSSNMDLSNRIRYYVWVSFVEIYNEAVYDLLVSSDRRSATKLCIREDANGLVYVKGAKQAFVRSGEEAFDIMVAGKHNLQVAATGVHAQSSRSHCIFTITMLAEAHDGVRTSSVRFCDLAGSERVSRTRNTGARMAESRAINSSLHVLERCLYMLRRKQRQKLPDASFVPYRESKLTRLLGAGLSGARGEAVSMVVTLNPAPEFMHETRHVLQLAAVAKNLQVNNTIVESTLESSCSQQDTSYFEEIQKLRAENERLVFELMQAQSQNRELLASMEDSRQQSAELMRELVEEAKDMSRTYYSQQLAAQEERHRAQMEELKEEYEEKLANTGRPSHSTGTPSRALQNKITQLMTVMADLEEKLTAEKLARTRDNDELQYLRACLDERDHEICSNGNTPEPRDNEMVVLDILDSEDETDDCLEDIDNNDYLNCTSEENLTNSVNSDKTKTQIVKNEISTTSSTDENNIEYSLSKITADDKINNSSTNNEYTTHSTINSANNSTCDDSSIRNQITIDGVGNYMDNTTYNDDIKESSVRKENIDSVEDAMIVNVITHNKESSQSHKASLVLTETVHNEDMNHNQCTKDQTYDMIHSLIKENDNTDKMDSSVTLETKNNIIPNTVQCDSEYFALSSSNTRNDQLSKEQKNVSPKTKGSNDSDESNILSNSQTCNSSLAQFENFENAMISQGNNNRVTNLFISHFDEAGISQGKKIYFDNLDNAIDSYTNIKNRLTFVKSSANDKCLGSMSNAIEPSEKLNPKDMKLITKHQSVDIFDEYSPHLDLAKIKLESNRALGLNQKYDSLQEMENILSQEEESKAEFIIPERGRELKSENTDLSINMQSDKGFVEDCSIKIKNTESNNTLDEFESIYKNITTSKVSDFDELLSQDTVEQKSIAKTQILDSKLNPNIAKVDCSNLKYNLRHKAPTSIGTQDNTVATSLSDIKHDTEDKGSIEMKAPKRNLRLRRRKNKDTDIQSDDTKLKDIANLQEEFSDITLDIPAPTPIKSVEPDVMLLTNEKENFVMETQSCPSKSVTRSRRKLFTPRAEPLDESVPSTGDSTERICVPRPSYRKGRARRKL